MRGRPSWRNTASLKYPETVVDNSSHRAHSLRRRPPFVPVAATAVLVVLLVLPTLLLLARALNADFLEIMLRPVVLEALRLSLLTTALSMVFTLLFGTPVAYLLARYSFPGRRILDALLDLPIVLPPVVAGVSLLLVFGRRGLIGSWLNDLGVNVAFTTTAVVMAQVFVASPFYIRTMKAGFGAVSERLEALSWTLGKSERTTFWRITWPLTLPFLVEGLALAWARALGEFGATIVFAGSLQGVTRTMPLAIYAELERDLGGALIVAAVLTLASFILLFVFRLTLRFRDGQA